MVGLSVVLKFRDHASDFVTNCGLHVSGPLSSRKAHRGGTVRHCRSIKGHNDVDRTGEANTSPCFLSRGSSRLLLRLPFCLLLLLVYLLFPTLVLILLAFVSHCVPPFPVFPHLLAARAPLRRQFCPCVLSWVFLCGQLCIILFHITPLLLIVIYKILSGLSIVSFRKEVFPNLTMPVR